MKLKGVYMGFEDILDFDLLEQDDDETLDFEEAMIRSIQKRIDAKVQKIDDIEKAESIEDLKKILLAFFNEDLKKDSLLLKSLLEKKGKRKTIASA
jgi:uncharacterized protein YaaW (UPF0174 family)